VVAIQDSLMPKEDDTRFDSPQTATAHGVKLSRDIMNHYYEVDD
jgi:hypothetical protein